MTIAIRGPTSTTISAGGRSIESLLLGLLFDDVFRPAPVLVGDWLLSSKTQSRVKPLSLQRYGPLLSVPERGPPKTGMPAVHTASPGRRLHPKAAVLYILRSRYLQNSSVISTLLSVLINI